MIPRTTILLIFSVAAAVSGIGSPSLETVVKIARYYDHVYTADPASSDYVVFVGETVVVDVSLINYSDVVTDVLWPEDQRGTGYVTATLKSADRSEATPFQIVSLTGWDTAGVPLLLPDTEAIPLPSRARLTWRIEARVAVQPGLYELTFDVNATDGERRPSGPMNPSLHLDVRAPTSENAAERFRRLATERLSLNDFTGAFPCIERLLELNRESAEATKLLGAMALQRGEKDEAARYFSNAIAQVQNGRDQMLLRFLPPQRVAHYLRTLQELLSRTR
jgi:tetratricopeptide (TPR) repeat protein